MVHMKSSSPTPVLAKEAGTSFLEWGPCHTMQWNQQNPDPWEPANVSFT